MTDLDSALKPYIERLMSRVTNRQWAELYAERLPMALLCGCMGPQNGEPFCPCRMRGIALEKCQKEIYRLAMEDTSG